MHAAIRQVGIEAAQRMEGLAGVKGMGGRTMEERESDACSKVLANPHSSSPSPLSRTYILSGESC